MDAGLLALAVWGFFLIVFGPLSVIFGLLTLLVVGPLQSFAGQLFALAVGSGLTVIGSWSIQYYTDERTRRRIRKMLKVDVEASGHRLGTISEGLESEALRSGRTDNLLSTKMYDQHLVELGVLSEKEIKYAAEYYRRVDRMADYQTQYQDLLDSEDEFEDESMFEAHKMGIKEQASKEAEDTLIKRDDLLDELEAHLESPWPF